MKQRIATLIVIVLALQGCGDRGREPQPPIGEQTATLFDSIVAVRRHLHTYPELAGRERQTKAYIENYLAELDIDLLPDVYGNGVVGVLNRGKPGRKIGWRADMDAISTVFPDAEAFPSVYEGAQHGCGHDVHMAIGLGIASVLAARKDVIDGEVYFIFQPEEETFLGAKGMIDRGLVRAMELDEIYALHVTALPVGEIMVRGGELYAYQRGLRLSFDKKLPAPETAEWYDSLRAAVGRSAPGAEPSNLALAFDNQRGLYNEHSIFNDYRILDKIPAINRENNRTDLFFQLYETDASRVAEIIPDIVEFVGRSDYGSALDSITFVQANPTVFNDRRLTDEAVAIISAAFGERSIVRSHGQIPYFNDDFCYFQDEIDGVYFLLGGSNTDEGISAMNHAPGFRVDERCMETGIEVFSTLLLERMREVRSGRKTAI